MKRAYARAAIVALAFAIGACTSKPPAEEAAKAATGVPTEETLRQSFAHQLQTNKFIKDFKHTGDDLTFSGPGAEGGLATWRVHFDSARIEPTSNAGQPYKGTMNSSWYSDDQLVRPGGRNSNLPIELTDNGLAQICWAFWDAAAKEWSWE